MKYNLTFINLRSRPVLLLYSLKKLFAPLLYEKKKRLNRGI